jgi:hypothetical protein
LPTAEQCNPHARLRSFDCKPGGRLISPRAAFVQCTPSTGTDDRRDRRLYRSIWEAHQLGQAEPARAAPDLGEDVREDESSSLDLDPTR